MEAPNEIGREVVLHFKRVADPVGRLKGRIATVPGSAQRLNSRIRPQKNKKIKASYLSQNNEGESTSSDEHREDSDVSYESDSSSSKNGDIRSRHMRKTRKRGLTK